MRISHNDAVSLEYIVRGVYNCDRGGVAGIAEADFFEHSPISAAVAILAPLSFRAGEAELEDVSEFWEKYRTEFSHDNIPLDQEYVDEFINDLRALAKKYY